MTQYSGVWTSRQQLQAQGAGNWPSQYPPDAQFNYVTLLLNGDGVNAAQNNTFLDSSTNNFTITRNGNTTQGTFSPYGSNWSNYFPGTAGQSISMPTNTSLDLTGDFTIECWCYANSFNAIANILFDTSSTGTVGDPITELYVTGTGVVYFYTYGAFAVSTAAGAVSLGAWNHIAVTRSGSAINIWVNGVSAASASNATSLTAGYSWYIGDRMAGAGSANYPWRGYISNFRVVKGTAVYSSTFTPSKTPLTAISGTSLLTCQSNRFVDNSTVANVLTVNNANDSVQRFNPFGQSLTYNSSTIGGSGYFDGTTDYLSVADNSAISFGTGDFTVEAWFYIPSASGGAGALQTLFSIGKYDTNGILFRRDYFQFGASITNLSAYLKYNQWFHCAMCRSSGTFKVFINGVSIYSVANSTSQSSASGVYIGTSTHDPSGETLQGYISDQRLIKGVALYTTTFTPPTAPLTAVSGAGLLLSMTNAAIYDSAEINNLETVGNAQISTSVVKYGTGSIAFDGTGDYLASNAASTDLYTFGTGDFTIEFWLYLNTTSGTQIVYDCRPTGTNGAQPIVFVDAGVVKFQHTNTVRITGPSLTTGAWYHVAVARSGTNTKMFVNGAQGGSTYSSDTTSYTNSAGRPIIGIDAANTSINPLNGYIDDLRITKGYARYTNPFTPPTQSLPTYGPSYPA